MKSLKYLFVLTIVFGIGYLGYYAFTEQDPLAITAFSLIFAIFFMSLGSAMTVGGFYFMARVNPNMLARSAPDMTQTFKALQAQADLTTKINRATASQYALEKAMQGVNGGQQAPQQTPPPPVLLPENSQLFANLE